LRTLIGVFAALAAASFVSSARADSVADFYRSRTVTVLSGNSASGAYSTYARVLERHIGRHIPGKPSTVVKFMPGAGGITFANWLYNVAPRDGTAFGTFHQRMGLEPLIAPSPNIKFTGKGYTWIGSMAKQSGVCFTWHTSATRTVADAKARETTVGYSGASSADAVMPRMMNAMLGTRFKAIGGYSGADILLAVERGEVEGRCGFGWVSLKTTRPDWIGDRKVNVIVQFALKRHPDLPDVPLMADFAANDDDRKVLQTVFGTTEMGRPYAGPPGLPADRTAALRTAFTAALDDPQLKAEAAKQNLELDPLAGAEVESLVAGFYATPEVILKRAAQFLGGDDGAKQKKKKKAEGD
jgi:tripartite-type tricarboxylate transporter receptor subunit TctC